MRDTNKFECMTRLAAPLVILSGCAFHVDTAAVEEVAGISSGLSIPPTSTLDPNLVQETLKSSGTLHSHPTLVPARLREVQCRSYEVQERRQPVISAIMADNGASFGSITAYEATMASVRLTVCALTGPQTWTSWWDGQNAIADAYFDVLWDIMNFHGLDVREARALLESQIAFEEFNLFDHCGGSLTTRNSYIFDGVGSLPSAFGDACAATPAANVRDTAGSSLGIDPGTSSLGEVLGCVQDVFSEVSCGGSPVSGGGSGDGSPAPADPDGPEDPDEEDGDEGVEITPDPEPEPAAPPTNEREQARQEFLDDLAEGAAHIVAGGVAIGGGIAMGGTPAAPAAPLVVIGGIIEAGVGAVKVVRTVVDWINRDSSDCWGDPTASSYSAISRPMGSNIGDAVFQCFCSNTESVDQSSIFAGGCGPNSEASRRRQCMMSPLGPDDRIRPECALLMQLDDPLFTVGTGETVEERACRAMRCPDVAASTYASLGPDGRCTCSGIASMYDEVHGAHVPDDICAFVSCAAMDAGMSMICCP